MLQSHHLNRGRWVKLSRVNGRRCQRKLRVLNGWGVGGRSERMRKTIQRDVDGSKGYTAQHPGYDTVRPARYRRVHVSEDDSRVFLGQYQVRLSWRRCSSSNIKFIRSRCYVFAANNLTIKIRNNRRLFLRRLFAHCIYHIRIHILASVNVKFFYLLLHPYFILLHARYRPDIVHVSEHSKPLDWW